MEVSLKAGDTVQRRFTKLRLKEQEDGGERKCTVDYIRCNKERRVLRGLIYDVCFGNRW